LLPRPAAGQARGSHGASVWLAEVGGVNTVVEVVGAPVPVGTPAEEDAPVATVVARMVVVVVEPFVLACALDAPTPVMVVVVGAGALASTEKLVPVVSVTPAPSVVCP